MKKEQTNKQGFEPMAKIVPRAFDRVMRQAESKERFTSVATEDFEISRPQNEQGFEPIANIALRAFDRVTQLTVSKQHVSGVATGYEELDRMTAGLQPSNLIILAARPSMGKTSLSLNIVQHAVFKHKVPTAIFSLEMSSEQLAMRMLCSVGKVDSQRVRTGHLVREDWPKLTRATGMLTDAPIYIDDTAELTVLEMRAKARQLKAEHHLGLVVVDCLQLMQGDSRSENRNQEISEISRSLKAMAKELDVPVLVLSQLNRSLESRTDKRPMISDLRDSGEIEDTADVIMFIYRDEVYNKAPDNPNKGIAEVIVGKQRNGPTGTVRLTFQGEHTSFENYTDREPPNGASFG
jgi:replicative DNA helicase